MPLISPEQWRHFDEEGWIVLPPQQVWGSDASAFHALQERIDQIQLGKADVPYEKMMMQLDSTTGKYEDAGVQTLGFKGATLRYRKIQNLEHCPCIREYLRKPIFREACERTYGKDVPISSFRTMFFSKPARVSADVAGGTALPWHQDRWKVLDRDPLLNVYLALDDATTASGCMRIVPRSHKLGILNPAHHSAFLTSEQADHFCGEGKGAVDSPLKAGEVALMHNWLVHCSGVNVSASPRRALSVSYMDANTRLQRTDFEQFVGGDLASSGYPEGGADFPLIFGANEEALMQTAQPQSLEETRNAQALEQAPRG
jgi:phytanoyl-CoA hydroxylase